MFRQKLVKMCTLVPWFYDSMRQSHSPLTALSNDLHTLRNSAANVARHFVFSGSLRYFAHGTAGFRRLLLGDGA